MKIGIRYLSKSGNTKKLADAIGEELKIKPKDITYKLKEDLDILFIGGATYGFNIDNKLREFINNISINIKEVIIFTTSAFSKRGEKEIKKLFERKNIKVNTKSLHIKSQFKMFNKGKPNVEDLVKTKEFTKEILENQ